MAEKTAFGNYQESINKLPAGERQKKLKADEKRCICARCPTYEGTGEKKLLFCSYGESKMIHEEKGCLCPGCPVQETRGMKWVYYCTKGSAKEVSGIK